MVRSLINSLSFQHKFLKETEGIYNIQNYDRQINHLYLVLIVENKKTQGILFIFGTIYIGWKWKVFFSEGNLRQS